MSWNGSFLQKGFDVKEGQHGRWKFYNVLWWPLFICHSVTEGSIWITGKMKSISRALDGWISFCWRKWSKRKLSPIVSPPPPFSIIVQDPFINVKFQMVTDKQLLENWNKRDRGNLGTQRCANERLRDNGPTRNVTMMLLRSVTSRKSRKFLFTVQEGKTYDKKCHWLIYGRWQLIIRHLIKLFDLIEFLLLF